VTSAAAGTHSILTDEIFPRDSANHQPPCYRYKNGKETGAVTGCYGGSFMHYMTVMANLGGEHFNFTYNSPNRFRFLGNGQAIGENMGAGDMAWYMDAYDELRKKMEKDL
jgi:hypothetical protein